MRVQQSRDRPHISPAAAARRGKHYQRQGALTISKHRNAALGRSRLDEAGDAARAVAPNGARFVQGPRGLADGEAVDGASTCAPPAMLSQPQPLHAPAACQARDLWARA